MEKKLLALCPVCGLHAEILKFLWNGDEEDKFAVIRCKCGLSCISVKEGRILKFAGSEPFLGEPDHDLLIRRGLDWHRWDTVIATDS